MANITKTYSPKANDIKRQWHIIDASNQTLGRLAGQVALLLMGKHKPIYSPSQDTGDFVIVINADKVRVTGGKPKQKLYYRHSAYPTGLKTTTLETLMATHPTRVIEHAVKGMLPHTYLSAKMKKRLRIYSSDARPDLPQLKAAAAKAKEEPAARPA
ncbi:MAG: 50S ribosomal protein L13 [Chloroflexi bacterium]|nr:50S ribosomal protein L13 [Chloroflexota bacterium]